MKRILVIRLGALGDFVLTFGPFAAIRASWPDAHIVLLTTPPFAELAQMSPWFDEVRVETRASWLNIAALLRLRRALRGFDFVYDLQTSKRTNRYFWLAGKPNWSGTARGSSNPHANPGRNHMHSIERQREQLQMGGVRHFPVPDLSWLVAAPIPFDLPARFALLVPGTSPHHLAKRWPLRHFADLAVMAEKSGLMPVVVGSRGERPLAVRIQESAKSTLDLTGKTSIAQLAAIAARAELTVGGDTGPVHLAAAVGCDTLALFSGASDPKLAAPRTPTGHWGRILREKDLANLSVAKVAAELGLQPT